MGENYQSSHADADAENGKQINQINKMIKNKALSSQNL